MEESVGSNGVTVEDDDFIDKDAACVTSEVLEDW